MERPFPAYQGDEPFAFICYAHDDDEVVYPELVRLREQGVNIWYDEGISPGAEWSDVLADRIKNCSSFLYYVSPRSVASEICRQELLFAQEGSCEILAVHLEHTDLPDGLRLRLGHRQAVMRYEQSSEMYEEKLLAALPQAQTGVRTLDETPTRSRPGTSHRTGVLAGAGALIVAVVALVWYLNPMAPSAIDSSPSILVLPFENLSPLEENAFFAAGLHEDLLTYLSQIEELTVISRTSSIALAKTGKTIPEMAAQVDVAHVLEGSVRRDGGRVKITVQLIEAERDRHFWAQTYDRQLTDIFDVQRDIAEAISRELQLRLDAELIARFAQAPTDNLAAYDLFLRGRGRLDGRVKEFDQAVALFERAVALLHDPRGRRIYDTEPCSALTRDVWAAVCREEDCTEVRNWPYGIQSDTIRP
ncbi:MAG: TIR domain-containing protein [Pseudomonadales bacterium]